MFRQQGRKMAGLSSFVWSMPLLAFLLLSCSVDSVSAECTECEESGCPQRNCTVKCDATCPSGYYTWEQELTSGYACSPPTTTTTTTTPMPMPMGFGNPDRRKRQSIGAASDSTTHIRPTVLCRRCDIANCTQCKNHTELEPLCEKCDFDLRVFNNTCVMRDPEIEEGDLGREAIAGIAVGTVVFIASIVLLVVFIRKRIKRYSSSDDILFDMPVGDRGDRRPVDKVNQDELEEAQDRYGKDPTCRLNSKNEHEEVDQLPEAPPPPSQNTYNDMSDNRNNIHQDHPKSNTPFESADSVYNNVPAVNQALSRSPGVSSSLHPTPEHPGENIYGNAGVLQGQTQLNAGISEVDQQEVYLNVPLANPEVEEQEIYLNTAAVVTSAATAAEDPEEIYLNQACTEEETQEIYMNENVQKT